MQTQRAAHAFGLALLLALSTVAAPASAQDAVQDPKQPSVDNPHMHIWGSSDLNQCWTHFDGNDSAGSASEGYGEETFGEGQQVEVDFSCKMQENLKQDLYLDANGTITFEFVVAIYSANDCNDDNQECIPLTFTLMKGSTEIAKQEFPSVNKNGDDEALQWNLNANETMARWNKSIEEPEIRVQFSWAADTGLLCGLLFDCTGEFRFYYSDNENNDTVEVNFPVINHTIPGEGGGGDGIGGAVSDALPGFGLVAGIGALALAAVGASRFTREE
ncbi:MAG TPA: hypothetical protein EYQ15_06390 [Candidatus Poseidoniales archaeon]|nr:hypothetical protein [Candidatus Poseidoniales archaeon]